MDRAACKTCGLVAPRQNLVGKPHALQCPPCLAGEFEAQRRSSGRKWMLAIGAVVLLNVLVGGKAVFLQTLTVIAVIVGVGLGTALLHEAGHALVGLAVGERIVGITIGRGPRLLSFSVGTFRFELRLTLLGGLTMSIPRGGRWRRSLVLLAGVTLESVLLVLVWRWQPGSDLGETVRDVVMFTTALDIVVNLWPQVAGAGGALLATDGGQLIELWRNGADGEAVSRDRLRHHGAFMRAIVDDSPEAALAAAEVELREHPDDANARFRYGTALTLVDRYREAWEVLVSVIGNPEIAEEQRWLVLNNAAWAGVMCFDPALLADADRYAAAAYSLRPTEPAVRGTRGCVLVMLGRHDEGSTILRRALTHHVVEPKHAALNAAFVAIGAAAQGDVFEARTHYLTMCGLDSECPARIEVERRLAPLEVEMLASLAATGTDGSLPTVVAASASGEMAAALEIMALLTLRQLDGELGGAPLVASDVAAVVGDRPVSAGELRAAATQVLGIDRAGNCA